MRMDLCRIESLRKSPISNRRRVSKGVQENADEHDKLRRISVQVRCADHDGGSKPEKPQGLLCGMISQRDAQGHYEVAVKHTCSAGENIG